ncbi:MAG: T9SS type A sorting domain-containing protein [Bacteroidota bacterium]
MKLFNLFWIVFLWALLPTTSFTQVENYPCGSQPTAADLAFMKLEAERRKRHVVPSHRMNTKVRIQVHVLRDDNGSNGISSSALDTRLDAARGYFANANVELEECSAVNYINSTTYNDFSKTEESALRAAHDVSGAINIYLAKRVVNSSGGALCGYAYYPNSTSRATGTNFTIIDKDCSVSTFTHELGHSFSLIHTHGSVNGQLTNELVNGSNCSTAGDQICDTPADPQLSTSVVNSSCVYTGSTTDANGDTFVPDPRNIMSYSRKSCRDRLSTGQYNRISFSAINDYQNASCNFGESCSAVISSFPAVTDFESDLGWNNVAGDDFNWLRQSGSTPSGSTGPSGASQGTYYAYMEVSSPNYPTKNAHFVSPCYDLTAITSPEVTFRYHMYGSTVGTLRLEASTDGTSWSQLWSRSGDQGNAWLSATVSLNSYTSNDRVRLRFSGTSGTSYTGDMAIDDVQVDGTSAPSTTTVLVRYRALGSNGNGARLRIRKMSNSNYTGSNSIQETKTSTASSSWVTSTYSFSGSNIAANRFRIYFDNDTGGRDVQIDWIEVSDTRYQSEASNTYSTGTWTSGGGCSDDFKQRDRLHCNGYFHYNTSGAADPIGDEGNRIAAGQLLKVFPNPFRNQFTVQLPNVDALGQVAALHLFDATGRLVLRQEGLEMGSSVDLSPVLPAGLYILRVVAGDWQQEVKVVKN